MNNRSTLQIALFILILLPFIGAHSQDYYFSSGSQQALAVNDDFVSIRFVDEGRSDPYSFAMQTPLLTDNFVPFPISPDFWCYRLEPNMQGRLAADSLTALPAIEVAHPSYLSQDSLQIFLTNRIVIRFRAGIDQNYVDSIFESNGLVIDAAEIPRQDVFVVNKSGATTGEPLELANALYLIADVE